MARSGGRKGCGHQFARPQAKAIGIKGPVRLKVGAVVAGWDLADRHRRVGVTEGPELSELAGQLPQTCNERIHAAARLGRENLSRHVTESL